MPLPDRILPENNTVKLVDPLKSRVEKAMKATGTVAFAEYARKALLEQCRRDEQELRRTSPQEYEKIYGESADPSKTVQDT